MKLTTLLQRFHWLITITLALLLVVESVAFLKVSLDYSSYCSGRPQGPEITLSKPLPVYAAKSATVAFTLPTGTILQSSTRNHFSTLGKYYGSDYLLIIHRNDPLDKSVDEDSFTGDWVRAYSFTPNDNPFDW